VAPSTPPQPTATLPAARLITQVPPAPPSAPVPPRPKLGSPTFRKAVNGKHHGGHRKRAFDYNRYFSDLLSAVSSHSNQFEAAPVNTNGYALEAGRFISPPPSQVAPLAPAAVLSANSEVIAHQKALIEEHKRLIQEQTKLIEEKTQLIAEKNQLLKLQTEFIEQKLV